MAANGVDGGLRIECLSMQKECVTRSRYEAEKRVWLVRILVRGGAISQGWVCQIPGKPRP